MQAEYIFREVAELLSTVPDAQLFGDTEFVVRDRVLKLVAHSYKTRLAQKNGYVGSGIDCPWCDRTAAFRGYRRRSPLSLGGPVEGSRAYYYCRSCGYRSCPWDAEVGLTEQNLTPAVVRLATLTGAIADSFEKGGELLEETAAIHLSESTIQRTTEATGRQIAAALTAGRKFGPAHPWAWFCDYVGLDATGVRQQGPDGAKADGRMTNVGMIFNPLPDPERVFVGLLKRGTRMAARYVSGLYPLAEMGPQLRRQGVQVGMDQADVWIALTDGGAGLEAFMETNFRGWASVYRGLHVRHERV